ncbi:hypothetical protein AAM22_gp81 [Pantoea phage vB_PagM_AAM22]|nr:hypothetical protein AAM22_gp81 [Pantoea phage vB_PagM_AAM22]
MKGSNGADHLRGIKKMNDVELLKILDSSNKVSRIVKQENHYDFNISSGYDVFRVSILIEDSNIVLFNEINGQELEKNFLNLKGYEIISWIENNVIFIF